MPTSRGSPDQKERPAGKGGPNAIDKHAGNSVTKKTDKRGAVLQFSLLPCVTAKRADPRSMRLQELFDSGLMKHRQLPCTRAEFDGMLKDEQTRIKGSAGAFLFATFPNPGDRTGETSYTALTLDLEGEDTPSYDVVLRQAQKVGCAVWVYTTARHTPDEPRMRVIVPLARPLDSKDAKERATVAFAKLLGVKPRPESWSNVVAYVPTHMAGSKPQHWQNFEDDEPWWEWESPAQAPTDVEQPAAVTSAAASQDLASPDAAPVPGLTPEIARAALDALPADWCDEEGKWFKVAAAIHQQFGPAAYDMLDAWSQSGQGYDETNNRRRWDAGFRDNGTLFTFRSIMYQATQNGWKPPHGWGRVAREGQAEWKRVDRLTERARRGVGRIEAGVGDWTAVPRPRVFVPGMLAQGCHLLVASPKFGKTFLMLQLAVALANGDSVLGRDLSQPYSVAVLALEEGDETNDTTAIHPRQRIAARLQRMGYTQREAQAVKFVYEIEPLAEGGSAFIEQVIAEHDVTFIDSMVMLRIGADEDRSKGIWSNDYEFMKPFQRYASAAGHAVVLLAHAGKGASAKEPLDVLAGTQGLQAAVDGMWICQTPDFADPKRVRMYVTGRDVRSQGFELRFRSHDCRWSMLGEWLHLPPKEQAVLDVLLSEPENAQAGFSYALLADRTGISETTVRGYAASLFHKRLAANQSAQTKRSSVKRPPPPRALVFATEFAYRRQRALAGIDDDDLLAPPQMAS